MAVYWVAAGTGVHNTMLRRTAGFKACLPAALVDPAVERFKPLREFFGIDKLGLASPRYLDFLNIITVKFRKAWTALGNGGVIIISIII